MAKRQMGVAAIASTMLALALPSAASAGNKAGERTFSQSFPVASKLCENVETGKERKAFVPFAASILADCATLKANFGTAQTTVVTARTTIRAQITADKAAITTACPTPADDTKPACVNARHAERRAIKALRGQLLVAVHTYYKTVEADRHVFWTAIKALRALQHAVADKPIKVESS